MTGEHTDTGIERDEAVIEGVRRQVLRAWPIQVIAALTGFLLLKWSILLAARYLLGYRTDCRVSYNGRRVRMQMEARCFGRLIRSSDEFTLSRDLLTIRLEKRYPFLLSMAGTLGLIVGAWVGFGGIIDSIQANYAMIGVAGISVLSAGILLDICFGTVADSIGSRESLHFTLGRSDSFLGSRGIRVVGVAEHDAQEFVQKFLALAP